MARKSKAAAMREKIELAYWDAVLIEGKAPASVYALCRSIELEETDFYAHYTSLDAIESLFWKATVTETVEVLHTDEDYLNYDCQQKLLAFYYTYFAHVQQYRSRVVGGFPINGLCGMRKLVGMRSAFLEFAGGVIHQGIEEGVVMDRKQLNQFYDKGLFEQFRAILYFYTKDDSEKFQDTDAFIEKTVKFVIDSMQSGVLDSAIDVARFLMRKSPFAK